MSPHSSRVAHAVANASYRNDVLEMQYRIRRHRERIYIGIAAIALFVLFIYLVFAFPAIFALLALFYSCFVFYTLFP